MSQAKPDPNATFAQLLTYSEKLTAALDSLEALGGFPALSATMKRTSVEKALNALKETRQAIERETAKAKPPKPAKPARPGPPPPKPDPPASQADAKPIKRPPK